MIMEIRKGEARIEIWAFGLRVVAQSNWVRLPSLVKKAMT